ncbi:Uncharacterised protein [Actinomadura madurae]|nr:Uncharacterised protein [Actinomadura madurae]
MSDRREAAPPEVRLAGVALKSRLITNVVDRGGLGP